MPENHIETRDSLAIFHDDALACLKTMADICRHLDSRDVFFNFTTSVLEINAITDDHVAVAICHVSVPALVQYSIEKTCKFTIDKGRFCEFFNVLPATAKEVAIEATRGDLHMQAGDLSRACPLGANTPGDTKDSPDLGDFINTIIKENYNDNMCKFSLPPSAFFNLTRHASRICAEGDGERNSRGLLLLEGTRGQKSLLQIISSEGRGEVRIDGRIDMGNELRFDLVPLMTFRRDGHGSCIHAVKGYAESRFDPKYFTFMPAIDTTLPETDGKVTYPLTFLLGNEKPCVLQLSFQHASVTYVVAPRVEASVERPAMDDMDVDDGIMNDFDVDNIRLESSNKWGNFIDDDYYHVTKPEFIANYQKYVDPECWDMVTINRTRHLISKQPIIARVPGIKGCISLADASFSLCHPIGDQYKKLKTVSCRHLVLHHEKKTMSFQRLPFVQSVIATANTFALGSFDAFSPRILIDSIREDARADKFTAEILHELVKNMIDSYDVYKRIYYLSYIIYLINHLGLMAGTPWPGIELGEKRRVLLDLVPDRVNERQSLKVHFPLECCDVLDAIGRHGKAMLPEAYARFLTSKKDIAELLDIAEGVMFRESIFQQTSIDAIIANADRVRFRARSPPCNLAQALAAVVPGDLDALRVFLLLHYLEIESAARVIDNSSLVKINRSPIAIMKKNHAKRDWVRDGDLFTRHMQVRSIQNANASLTAAMACFEKARQAFGDDVAQVAMQECPTMLLPAIELFHRACNVPRGAYLPEAIETVSLLKAALLPLVGDELAHVLDGKEHLGTSFRTREEWRRVNAGDTFQIPDAEVDALLAIETELGESIPLAEDIDEESFGFYVDHGHVTGLGLCEKELNVIPENIGNLQHLVFLRLMSNQIYSLPESICSLQDLVELDLRDNRLVELPYSIGNMAGLRLLDIGGNFLTCIPDSIGNLHGLVALSLKHNRLVALPDSIGNLRNLDRFKLYHNDLGDLPATIGNLAALKWLGLGHNKLVSIPATIGRLTGLATLDLQSNPLAELPDTIANLMRLKELRLYHDYLVHFSDSINDWLTFLKNRGAKVLDTLHDSEDDQDDE